jgi:hypothetical protein
VVELSDLQWAAVLLALGALVFCAACATVVLFGAFGN